MAILIKGGTLLTLDPSLGDLERGELLIEGERLTYVGPDEAGRIPQRARRVDATGFYVLPGLIDTHVHGSHGDIFGGIGTSQKQGQRQKGGESLC